MPATADSVLIIGAGIAGLAAALSIDDLPVHLFANAPIGQGAASSWSQGGIAAAIETGDSIQSHVQDSMQAAAGIADAKAVEFIIGQAQKVIQFLEQHGIEFDHQMDGHYALSREAAHSRARVARVKGDLTGPAIMAVLGEKILRKNNVTVHTNWQIIDLNQQDGKVKGAWLIAPNGQIQYFPARAVIMATGGVGYLYRTTSNPVTAIGEGIACAARAGALLADMEFVQFHPTTIAAGLDPSPLATEALRGEGAILINRHGERFMPAIDPLAELAPRDVVARAIFAQIQNGHGAFLDCRQAIGEKFADKFPKVFALCQQAGIDPRTTPIPVEPAAHYHMGGVVTDLRARTSLEGLWACGEVACTGAHGANRLASNSLLEAVVMARQAAADITAQTAKNFAIAASPQPAINSADNPTITSEIRQIMRDMAGVIRHRQGLDNAYAQLTGLHRPGIGFRADNMVCVAKLIVAFAQKRQESRGSHFRSDYPNPQDSWAKRQIMTLPQSAL